MCQPPLPPSISTKLYNFWDKMCNKVMDQVETPLQVEGPFLSKFIFLCLQDLPFFYRFSVKIGCPVWWTYIYQGLGELKDFQYSKIIEVLACFITLNSITFGVWIGSWPLGVFKPPKLKKSSLSLLSDFYAQNQLARPLSSHFFNSKNFSSIRVAWTPLMTPSY